MVGHEEELLGMGVGGRVLGDRVVGTVGTVGDGVAQSLSS
jgi:hypothetical protein